MTLHDRLEKGVVLEEYEASGPVLETRAGEKIEWRAVRVCVVCGGSFRPKRRHALTCSAKCRQRKRRGSRS
jgi:hypothetical protein